MSAAPSPLLLFVHGWGCDASVWDPVCTALRSLCTASGQPLPLLLRQDLGFRGAAIQPALPAGVPVLAVGHSLGVLHLLQTPPPHCAGLISINGFPRFSRAADWPDGVVPRLIDRMLARLDSDPAAVTADFLQRCGADLPAGTPLDPARLRDGLLTLRDGDARPQISAGTAPPLLAALAGTEDPIVSPAHSRAGFAGTVFLEGGHMLPLTAPLPCATVLLQALRHIEEQN